MIPDSSHPVAFPVLLGSAEISGFQRQPITEYRFDCWLLNCGLIPVPELLNQTGHAPPFPRSPEPVVFRPLTAIREIFRGPLPTHFHGLTLWFQMDGDWLGDGAHFDFADPDGELRELVMAVCRAECDPYLAQGNFLRLFSRLRATRPDAAGIRHAAGTPAAGEFAEALRRRLEAHLAEPFDAAGLARRFGLGESALLKRCRRECGMSPRQLLIRLRLQRAQQLLLSGWKLDAIAQETGFYDCFHLSRSFKQHLGVSPAEFLRSRHAVL